MANLKTNVIFVIPDPDNPIFHYLYVKIEEKIFSASRSAPRYLENRLANLENFSRFGFADLDYPFHRVFTEKEDKKFFEKCLVPPMGPKKTVFRA